jgi:hypothetical protein
MSLRPSTVERNRPEFAPVHPGSYPRTPGTFEAAKRPGNPGGLRT